MTKSKKFWAVAALISLAAVVFTGYSIYGRISLHFSGDTIEIRPAPVAVAQEEEENTAAIEAATDKEAATVRSPGEADKEGEAKVKAVKTVFEYKDAKAKSVLIAGTFTSWKDIRMTKKNGVWKAELYVLPGAYPYHFTVDGNKKPDPGKPKTPGGDSLISVGKD